MNIDTTCTVCGEPTSVFVVSDKALQTTYSPARALCQRCRLAAARARKAQEKLDARRSR